MVIVEKNMTRTKTVLNMQQKKDFVQTGFLIIKNFIDGTVCDLLINQAFKLIDEYDCSLTKTIFSTIDLHHAKTLYFLESGEKIRFFFEEDAIDVNGDLKSEKRYCINKIGHALHDLDPVFFCFSRLHKIAQLTKDLDIIDPLLIQSMYICKQPFFGAEVRPHQDATYLYTRGMPIIGFWFALQDATLDNGCLWVIPGGHEGILKSRILRDRNDRLATEIFDNAPWPIEKMVPLEVSRGSVVVLHGLLPHMSKDNVSARSRHAYILHVVSKSSDFCKDNWLQRSPQLPFRGFL